MSLKNVKIGRVNRLRLRAPEEYKQSKKPQMLSNVVLVDPDFLSPQEDEKKDFMKILTGLFALEIVKESGAELTTDELYLYDERAGIYEFYGGLSREEAEIKAFNEIKRIFFNKTKPN